MPGCEQEYYFCPYLPCLYSSESSNSIRQHIAPSRYHEQRVEKTDRLATEKEREERFHSEDRSRSVRFDVEGEEIRVVERGESVERELPTEKAVPKMSLSFANLPL